MIMVDATTDSLSFEEEIALALGEAPALPVREDAESFPSPPLSPDILAGADKVLAKADLEAKRAAAVKRRGEERAAKAEAKLQADREARQREAALRASRAAGQVVDPSSPPKPSAAQLERDAADANRLLRVALDRKQAVEAKVAEAKAAATAAKERAAAAREASAAAKEAEAQAAVEHELASTESELGDAELDGARDACALLVAQLQALEAKLAAAGVQLGTAADEAAARQAARDEAATRLTRCEETAATAAAAHAAANESAKAAITASLAAVDEEKEVKREVQRAYAGTDSGRAVTRAGF